MSRNRTFPIEVKEGCASVKIYKLKSGGFTSYQLIYYHGEQRIRFTRSSLEKVRAETASVVRKLANGEQDALSLTGSDKHMYLCAQKALADTGIDLETAAKSYAAVHELLKGTPLVDAVRFYVKHHSVFIQRTVTEVSIELVKQKQELGRSEVYVKDLRLRLAKFAASFSCNISSVTSKQVEVFLLRLKLSGRTQNNYRRLIGTLFKFAIKRGYVPKDHEGVTEVEFASVVANDIEIFTSEQMSKLLAAASPEVRPFLPERLVNHGNHRTG